jgi:hypothetical protein
MLNPPIRVEKHRANGTNLGTDGMHDHFREPIRIKRFHVIVEKEKNIPRCLFRGPIVHRREVEGTGVTEQSDPLTLP